MGLRLVPDYSNIIQTILVFQDMFSGTIALMYEEPGLSERGYRLHTVMVHEGDMN